ncbi:MAG: endonuclease/exonuclease/phosphatase family protein [Corynebacterium sp.]|nr:endonuclease/exonuclease/phosphatase family protein [Corynebacterium sp.]
MSVTVATINVNGIRAAVRERSATNRGLLPWLDSTPADVVLLQEVRATQAQALEALAPALDAGWQWVMAEAWAKGRAGVGILSRLPLTGVEVGIAGFEEAGRFISARVLLDEAPPVGPAVMTVASVYIPTGGTGTAKQDEKYFFLDSLEDTMAQMATAAGDPAQPYALVAGDWNICHAPQDLKNFATNKRKAGCLPDERAFMDAIFGTFPDVKSQVESHGDFFGAVDYPGTATPRPKRQSATDPQWFDVARRLEPESAPYTWWTYRGHAFDTDAGWRIDVQAVTAELMEKAVSTRVDKADAWENRWSDHAPLLVTYDLP